MPVLPPVRSGDGAGPSMDEGSLGAHQAPAQDETLLRAV
jgi:hypothetical protein